MPKKTHCLRGHALIPANLYVNGRTRSCIQCKKLYQRNYVKANKLRATLRKEAGMNETPDSPLTDKQRSQMEKIKVTAEAFYAAVSDLPPCKEVTEALDHITKAKYGSLVTLYGVLS